MTQKKILKKIIPTFPTGHLSLVELYLGLVHANDTEGTRRRIRTAQSVVRRFGVTIECGMGRTPTDELNSILQISRDLTSLVV